MYFLICDFWDPYQSNQRFVFRLITLMEAPIQVRRCLSTEQLDTNVSESSFSVGPTQNISIRLTSAVRSFGGEVLIDATVRQVLIENGRAVGVLVSNTDEMEECTSQEELDQVSVVEVRAKNVVCATSVYNLYNKFLPPDLEIVKKFRELSTIRQSNGKVLFHSTWIYWCFL